MRRNGLSLKERMMRSIRRLIPAREKGRRGTGKKDFLDRQHRSWRIKRFSRKVVVALVLIAALGGVGWGGYTAILRSDIFRMTEVSVQGNQVAGQQQILTASGLQLGRNLLTIDVGQIETRVRKEKWIERAWVKRRWPSRVEILVSEYQPFALVTLKDREGGKLHYMDARGVVFAPVEADRDLDYPVVNGPELSGDLDKDRFRRDSLGGAALKFLQLTAEGSQILPTQAVSEISVDPEKGLIVYLVDHPFPIFMGKEKIRVRFLRLVRLLRKLYKEETIGNVLEIRMDYGENKILVATSGPAGK